MPTMIDGIQHHDASSWKELIELFETQFSRNSKYIFRGQPCESYSLTPSLTRQLTNKAKFSLKHPLETRGTIARHFKQFKKSILGRRGSNPPSLSDNEAWALGQHHGLATPLLDWTQSAFVATYFAFYEDSNSKKNPGSSRSIWALNSLALISATDLVKKALGNDSKLKTNKYGVERELIELVIPDNDENERLIIQSGLFTKIPFLSSLEEWAKCYMPGHLHKINVPESERDRILYSLNQMNINHASLFPDVGGAAVHCNYLLELHGTGSNNPFHEQPRGLSVSVDKTNMAN